MPKPSPRENPGIEIAVSKAGGYNELGRRLGISGAAVTQWTQVPMRHVLTIERLFKVPRYELRPDYFEPPKRRRRAG
jgi:DNA-binding transcriptional regulator YdaS (Cro superfamily)